MLTVALSVNGYNHCHLQSCKTLLMQLHVDVHDSPFCYKKFIGTIMRGKPKKQPKRRN